MKNIFTLLFIILAADLIAQTYTQPTGNMVSSSVVTCGGTYVDNGGSGSNYSNSQRTSFTIYPAVSGQYVSVTFTSYDTQTNFDGIYVYDGPGGSELALLTGNLGTPFTYTSSSSTGALTFVFISNGSTNRSGWQATISCTATPGPGSGFSNSAQDCQDGGGTTVCGSSSFSGNSSGDGSYPDLHNSINGCLGAENQSSWYYFSPSAAGTVEFMITPSDPSDDYDFAVYGPFPEVQCPYNVLAQPIRCSYAAGGGNTGLQSGAGDNSEGSGGDRVVDPINVLADEVYVLVIDNYSTSTNPFDLNWTLSAGASLDCTTLPIELVSFNGRTLNDNTNQLNWITATETNNNFFTVERSNGEDNFEPIGFVNGAGNSNQTLEYSFVDVEPNKGFNYYRLKQTDFDGNYSYSPTLYIINDFDYDISPLYPNPTTDNFSLDINVDGEEEIIFIISDITGKQVLNNTSYINKFKTVQLNTTNLVSGIYFVSVLSSKNEIISTQKLIKE